MKVIPKTTLALLMTGALLCLCCCGAKTDENEKTVKTPDPVIRAEDLAFGEPAGSPARKYALRRIYKEEEIPALPAASEDGTKLAVYRSLNAQNSGQTCGLLLEWADELRHRAEKEAGIRLERITEKDVLLNGEKYDSRHPAEDMYMYMMSAEAGEGLVLSAVSEGPVTYYSLDGIGILLEKERGELPAIQGDDDEDLEKWATPAVSFVKELTGKDYTGVSPAVTRAEGADGSFILLRYKNIDISETSKGLLAPGGSSGLTVRLAAGGSSGYGLSRIRIMETYYEYVGDMETISLAEAEEMLEKGWYYGGTRCPVCRAASDADPADLSSFDMVQIEYYSEATEYALPWYVFYKHLNGGTDEETGEEYDDWAAAFVPAVKTEGLGDYFAGLAADHELSGHK